MHRTAVVLLAVLLAAAVGIALFVTGGGPAEPSRPTEPADGPPESPAEPPPPIELPDEPPPVDPADSNLSGTVVGPDGAPVAGARVWRRPGNAPPARADDEGRFYFPEQEPGEFRLLAAAPDLAPAMTEALALAAGERLEDVRVRLPPAGRITGRVETDAGAPVAGAELIFVSAAPAVVGLAQLEGESAAATTGDDGAFAIEDLAAGRYRLRAVAERHVPVLSDPVQLPEGGFGILKIVLETGPVVTGRVVNRDGDPVAGATVGPDVPATRMATAPGAIHRVKTEEDGTFVLPGPTEPTDVKAEAPGYASGTVEGVAPGSTGVEIVLRSPGSISGRVVADASGAPPAAFEVRAISTSSPFPGVPSFQPSGTAEKLGEGAFRITGLEPGEYHVDVYPEGDLAPGRAESVGVKEGEETSGVEVRLPAGHTLRGRVVDGAAGGPVAGAEVTADLSGNPMLAMIGRGEKRTARSGESGAFEVRGLREGATTLRVSHPEYAEAQKMSVAVPSKQEVVVELDRGGTLTVVVRRADGSPDPGAGIVVQRQFPWKQFVRTTDAEGRVVLTHVPPGAWMVMKMDMQAMREQGLAGADLKMKQVTIAEGSEHEVVIRPEGGVTIRGRVTRGGRPAAGAMVYLTKEGEEDQPLEGMKFGTSGADGAYVIEGVAPGKYTLALTQPGQFVPVHTERIEVADRGLEHDVDLPLAEAAGRVRDESGRGVPDVQVVAVTSDQASFRTGEFREAMGAVAGLESTDGEGRFRFTGLAPGTYVVRAFKDGLAAAFSDPFEVPAFGKGPEDVEIELAAGSRVRVTVRGPDGRPLGDAWVFATDEEDRLVPLTAMYGDTTASDGTAAFRLAPGRYRVEVQASGHPSAFRDLTVGRGAAPELRIDLPRAGKIELTVVDPEGRAVEGVRVDLVDERGRSVLRRLSGDAMAGGWQRTRTGEDGRLSFDLVAPGRYRVRAWSEDGRAVEKKVKVVAGETRAVEIEWERP